MTRKCNCEAGAEHASRWRHVTWGLHERSAQPLPSCQKGYFEAHLIIVCTFGIVCWRHGGITPGFQWIDLGGGGTLGRQCLAGGELPAYTTSPTRTEWSPKRLRSGLTIAGPLRWKRRKTKDALPWAGLSSNRAPRWSGEKVVSADRVDANVRHLGLKSNQ